MIRVRVNPCRRILAQVIPCLAPTQVVILHPNTVTDVCDCASLAHLELSQGGVMLINIATSTVWVGGMAGLTE